MSLTTPPEATLGVDVDEEVAVALGDIDTPVQDPE
jgi:hypothetical protein